MRREMNLIVLLNYVTLTCGVLIDANGKVRDLESVSDLMSFGFVVTIQKRNYFGGFAHCCGGSIINRYFVLSSAQCFANDEEMVLLQTYFVFAGLSETMNPNAFQSSNISNVFFHPGYTKFGTQIYDACLLQLKQKFEYNVNVRPVVLAQLKFFSETDPEEYFRDGDCVVAKWVCSNETSSSPHKILRVTSVSLISKLKCTKYLSLKNNQLCTVRDREKSKFCTNDFGYPLMCKGYQVGILSWSNGMDVWTRIDRYYEWIQQVKKNHNVGKKRNDFVGPKNYYRDFWRSIKTSKALANFQHPSRSVHVRNFPHIAMIQKLNEQGIYFHFCSGSVISEVLILTSAQCFLKNGRIERLNKFVVYAGTSDATALRHSQSSEVDAVHLHPDYNHLNKTHDVGLVKLKKRLVYNRHVRPVALTDSNFFNDTEPSDYFNDNKCAIYKWDCSTKHRLGRAAILKRIPISIAETSVCNRTVYELDVFDASQLCTVILNVDKNGFCWNDIGDPLICEGRQVGVLSWSFVVDAWSRIDRHYDWIKDVNDTYNGGGSYEETRRFTNTLPLIDLSRINNLTDLLNMISPHIVKLLSKNRNLANSSSIDFVHVRHALLITLNVFLIV